MNLLPTLLISLEMSESDRKLLVALLVVFVVLLFLAGFIGMLIRYVSNKMGERVITEIAEPIKYHILPNEKAAMKYAKIKNARLFVKESTPALLTLLGVLILWIIYSLFTLGHGGFTTNHFGIAGELLFRFEFVWEKNAIGTYSLMQINKVNNPTFMIEHLASYIIAILIIISVLYLIVMSQAYLARGQEMRKAIRSAYKKTLDGFNFYDDAASAARAEQENQQQQ
ncbi:MAG: hypothetical protein MJ238_04025 [Bacilli bacterium]|nr:hypothetical protein [Bacilli bacterium]